MNELAVGLILSSVAAGLLFPAALSLRGRNRRGRLWRLVWLLFLVRLLLPVNPVQAALVCIDGSRMFPPQHSLNVQPRWTFLQGTFSRFAQDTAAPAGSSQLLLSVSIASSVEAAEKSPEMRPESASGISSDRTDAQRIFETAAAVWFAVFAASGLFLSASYFRMRTRVLSGARPVRIDGFDVAIVESGHCMCPMVVGFFRPVICLPKDFSRKVPRSALELVVLHEWTHISRGDMLLKGLYLIVRCLHWYNPAVYLIARPMNADIERACDEAVVRRRPESREEYCRTILRTAQVSARPLSDLRFSAGSLDVKNQMKRRLFHILESGRRKQNRLRAAAELSLAAAIVLSTAAFAFTAADASHIAGNIYCFEAPGRAPAALYLCADGSYEIAGDTSCIAGLDAAGTWRLRRDRVVLEDRNGRNASLSADSGGLSVSAGPSSSTETVLLPIDRGAEQLNALRAHFRRGYRAHSRSSALRPGGHSRV